MTRKKNLKSASKHMPPDFDVGTPSLFDIEQLVRDIDSSPVNAEPKPKTSIVYLWGDARLPKLMGVDALVHVVNDRTAIWGAGFGKAVRHRWPEAQGQFRRWIQRYPHRLRLGEIHVCPIGGGFSIIQLIAQHGYGPSDVPRIRYPALKECLAKLADVARMTGAVIHMPRIGCGEAGGDWGQVEALISEELCSRGIDVFVYTPPRERNRTGGR